MFLPAPFADVHEVQHRAREGMIQYPGGFDDLVVGVSHEEALGGERVRLDVDVSAGDLVHERRLADVGEAAHE
ncbi:hypothetical protein ACHAWF_017302, partial [Thalassiosira exigua]